MLNMRELYKIRKQLTSQVLYMLILQKWQRLCFEKRLTNQIC